MKRILTGLFVTFALLLSAAGTASAETRTLKLYFIHTKERAEITYKRNGRYIRSGLDKVNRFLRDWRRDESTKMDPRVLDLLWEVYREVGARDYINVVSAYRSPATNSMLRSRSRGVAKNSQHTLGKAVDFFIPGVNLATLRKTALRMQQGGVGYYPGSGSPFVHLDVGSVRHWPRMKRQELMALFPDGRTAHIPSDGKPLAGYSQAMAAIKAGKQRSATVQVASAEEPTQRRGLLAALFGGVDEEEDTAESVRPGASVPQVRQPAVAAPAPVVPDPTPETILASLSPNVIPFPQAAPRGASVNELLALGDTAPSANSAVEAVDEAVLPADETVLASLDASVPVPTSRPDVATQDTPVQIAEAVVPGGLPMPADVAEAGVEAAGASASTGPSATVAAFVPLPNRRPDGEESREYVLAALPSSGPSYSAPPISDGGDAVVSRPRENTDRRLARLGSAPAASQRLSLMSNTGQTPENAIATGVKTTAKAAKPGPGDSRPDPKAVLVPIPRQVAQWALNPSPEAMSDRGTVAPSFRVAHVRSAPQLVYTAGFGRGNDQGQPNRFTGNAVTFLSVARFDKN
ncbi:MAG: DUF882 domain-containing protein [Rhizobiaceae bacterium]|nr:DUF882 domain-containing protein [Rhizobiaceae bacterium]